MTKKICFVSGGLSGGGQERALTNYANEFARNGYEVVIICLFKTDVFFTLDKSIVIIWPNVDREKNSKYIYALKLIPFIRREVKDIKAEVVISFGDWYNSYTVVATLLLKVRVFITNRMGPELGYGLFLNFFNKLTYPLADGLIVQTERAKSLLSNRFRIKNIEVIPNILNPIDIAELNPQKQIISIGRLSREKGHKILIEAFSRIKEKKGWKLIIIGDGLELDNLIEQSKNLCIEKDVSFLGHLLDFRSHLASASVFVLPSFYEGFPNALIEAMSVPIPCISSDCVAGPREIIEHKINGLLFQPGNVEELVQCLNELIENEELRTKIKTEAFKIREKYTLERSYKDFEYFVFEKGLQ